MTAKHFTSVLLSFALLAPLASVACGGSDEPSNDPEQNSSDITSSKKKLACSEVFGQCVALTPSSCQGGTWADATYVTCGGGLGVGCCVKPTPPPPPPPPPVTCPDLVPPAPGYCSNGTILTKKDANGCTYFECQTCPELVPPSPGYCTDGTIVTKKSANGCTYYDCEKAGTCASAGGTCVALTPTSCPSHHWADANKASCGGGVGVGCCLP